MQSACSTFLPSAPILRDAIPRQLLSLFALTYAGIFVLYFSLATLSYYTLFDHRMMTHPRFLPSQVKQEIKVSMDSFAPVAFMTLPWFLGDVRGWSKLYGSVAEGPFGSEGGYKAGLYMAGVSVAFLLFTDFLIYFVHKALHHPVSILRSAPADCKLTIAPLSKLIYKKIHKAHHKFLSASTRAPCERSVSREEGQTDPCPLSLSSSHTFRISRLPPSVRPNERS